MAKKKSGAKVSVAPPVAKQSLDDFIANWSDDDENEAAVELNSKKPINGHSKVANGNAKAQNGVKKETASDGKNHIQNGLKKELPQNAEDSDDKSELSGEEEELSDEELDGEELSGEESDGEELSGEESDGEDLSGDEKEEGGEAEVSDEEKGGATQQKRYLASLKDKDPEFFKFLKENDQELLEFNESSSEDEDDDLGEDRKVHKPPKSLEVASDESDFEADSDADDSASYGKKSNSVTKALLDRWTGDLTSKPNVATVGEVVQAFRSAVATISPSITESTSAKEKGGKKKAEPVAPKVLTGKYLVEGSTTFNGVVRLCLTCLLPAFNKILGFGSDTSRRAAHPRKAKGWTKLSKHLKIYTTDLITLLTNLSSGSVQGALLKHVQNMIPYFVAIPKSSKLLTKCLVGLWSSANEETVRVLAFMCLIRMTRISLERHGGGGDATEADTAEGDDDGEQSSLLETVLKQMYMAYVRNVKFTSPTAWPMIHFMRRSLAEIFNLNHQVAYRYAFIYIRQLTIHLRNAMMQKKGKDSLDSVYNWQFVHCTHLWTQLLCESFPSETLEPLIYPLVQVISGAIRLVYTPKFYPLRFHLCYQLVKISNDTKKFIPILPYYLDILNKYNFSKKSSKLSMKLMDFSCCLKVSKSQLTENGFKDATMEQIYCGIFEYLQANAQRISFPEMVVPLTFQIKTFLKTCHVANYCKKMKQILDKTIENGKFVMERRRKVTFGVRDLDQIQAWEAGLKMEGTPIAKFYNSFRKVKEQEKMKAIVQNEDLDDYNFVPKLKKKSSKSKEQEEFKGLLGDDSDEDDEQADIERFKMKDERNKFKKAVPPNKRKHNESSDDDFTGSDVSSDEEPEVKQRKLPPKPVRQHVPEDYDFGNDVQDEVQDLDMDDLGSDEEQIESAAESDAGSEQSEGGETDSDEEDE